MTEAAMRVLKTVLNMLKRPEWWVVVIAFLTLVVLWKQAREMAIDSPNIRGANLFGIRQRQVNGDPYVARLREA
jgi:hypothetical protein